MKPAVRVLLLSEDKNAGTWAGLRAIAGKALELVQPGYRRDRLDWRPASPEQQVVFVANRWIAGPDTRGDRQRFVTALRTVVNHLLAPSALPLVLWHIDADVPWSRTSDSDSLRRFADDMVPGIRRALEHEARNRPGLNVDALMAQVIPMHPHGEAESWLYQAFDELERCAAERGCADILAPHLATWRADRSRLDEVAASKDVCCVQHHDNERLGQRFPAEEVWGASPSFTRFVDLLLGCEPLSDALRA